MAITREEAAEYLSRYDSEYYTPQCREAHQLAIEALRKEESRRWIPVTERLPEEHDSIFFKMYGTSKWFPDMPRKTSDTVIVCMEYVDGTRKTQTMRMHDGVWPIDLILQAKVTHWMPLPEPPKEVG